MKKIIGIFCIISFGVLVYYCGINKTGSEPTLAEDITVSPIIENTENQYEEVPNISSQTSKIKDFADEKERLYDMMLNSVDNYSYARGTIIATNNQLNNPTKITFETDIKKGIAYEEYSNKELSGKTTTENGLQKTYLNGELVHESIVNIEEKPTRARISTLSTGELTYIMRHNSTNLNMAKICLLPMEITFSMLTNFDYWEIEGVSDQCGIKCNVLIGKLNDYSGSKLNATSFKMWVDDATGVLMKYEAYNTSGDVVDYAKITDLDIY